MKTILKFLEKELKVPFQYVLFEEQEKYSERGIMKTCHSKKHNTRYVYVRLFYKKTF